MRTRRSQSSSDPVSRVEGHRSVLLHEAIEALSIQENDIVVDGTLGGAGHAKEIAQHLGPGGTLIGFDLDRDAIERAHVALEKSACAVHLIESNFRNLDTELHARGVEAVDKALFDLGWSSFQLDAGRGFSFQKDEPLRMTYSKEENGLTAEIVVNTWAEESLADVIYGFGEERFARRIAQHIVEARAKKRIETSSQLAEIIKAAVPAAYRFGRIHPATKTFQALRIAVNDELGAIDQGIRSAWRMLRANGRIAVITFHSIEDRAVKHLFRALSLENGQLLTKKPQRPSAEEISENPRARSAKLRVLQKLS